MQQFFLSEAKVKPLLALFYVCVRKDTVIHSNFSDLGLVVVSFDPAVL